MKAAIHLENLAPKDENKGYGIISSQTGIILMDEPDTMFVDSGDCDSRIMVTGFHVCAVPKWKLSIIGWLIRFPLLSSHQGAMNPNTRR